MPRKKSAQGAGTIRKRKGGCWEARYTKGYDPATGKQIQKSIYGKSQKEVRKKLTEVTAELDQGTYTEPIQLTIGEWLDIWLEEYTRNTKPHTRKSYKATVENHIKPVLGDKNLQKLTPVQIQQFVNRLQNCKNQWVPLNAKTVKNIHGVLHSSLQQAVRIGYLKNNPASLTVLTKRSKAEIHPLQDHQVNQFLAEIKGHPLEYLYLTDLFTGARESEILGLSWDDVDFTHGSITIRRQLQFIGHKMGGYQFTTPKSNKSRQLIPAKFVMNILHRQRVRQYEQRLAAGEAWDNRDNLVFTNEVGHFIKHDYVYRQLKRIFARMGLPSLRFHDLRHSFAVLSIQAGDDIKTVQENLGHYSAAFTLDVYGHVTEQMRRDSADRMDRLIHNLRAAK